VTEARRVFPPLARLPGLVNRLIERAHGVDTSGFVELEPLGLASPERTRYSPADWLSTSLALARLKPTESDVFLDFGAGKGRVMVAAARLRFGKVIGVEISPDLADAARVNLERSRGRRCGEVRIDVDDARTYAIPEGVTVAHFFAPFSGSIFAGALDNLIEASERDRTRLRLVYNYPDEHVQVMSTGKFAVIDAAPSNSLEPLSSLAETIVTYEAKDGRASVPPLSRRRFRAAERRLSVWRNEDPAELAARAGLDVRLGR
jgi:hypothetical protein